jgi:hypothetical protein
VLLLLLSCCCCCRRLLLVLLVAGVTAAATETVMAKMTAVPARVTTGGHCNIQKYGNSS